MTECCICHRPAPMLYHDIEQTDRGVVHAVCLRDRNRANRKYQRFNDKE